jgi:hypothetical protein
VLLDHERTRLCTRLGRDLSRGLGGPLEIALATILAESHKAIFPRSSVIVHRGQNLGHSACSLDYPCEAETRYAGQQPVC